MSDFPCRTKVKRPLWAKRPSTRNGVALFVRSERRQNGTGMLDARCKWDELPLAEKQVWAERARLQNKLSKAERQASMAQALDALQPTSTNGIGSWALDNTSFALAPGVLVDIGYTK